MNSNIFLVIDGEPISNDRILEYLQATGTINRFLSIVLRQHAISKALETFEVIPTPDIVQQRLIEFCTKQGLNNQQQLEAFLKESSLSMAELKRRLVSRWATEQLIHRMSESSLQDYFINQRSKLDKVRLSCIELEERGLAQELFDQLTEEQASFETLAKAYSLSASRKHGGRLEPAYRGNLPEELQLVLGNAQIGQVLGPLQIGKQWFLYRLDGLIPASLEGELEAELRVAIFEAQLMKNISQMEVKYQVTQWQYLQTSTH